MHLVIHVEHHGIGEQRGETDFLDDPFFFGKANIANNRTLEELKLLEIRVRKRRMELEQFLTGMSCSV